MKVHTTNYINTFIEIAPDSPTDVGHVPNARAGKTTVAQTAFEMISAHPYKYTSDDVLFEIFALKNELLPSEYVEARVNFFSKGQACLRASPLTKRYGWGIHHDEHGKIAIYGAESPDYRKIVLDPEIKKVKAMKSSKS